MTRRPSLFIPDFNEIAVYTRHDPYCTRLVEESDLIICCDFNKPSRQDHLAPLIQSAKAKKVLMDHHEGPDIDCVIEFSYPESFFETSRGKRLSKLLGELNVGEDSDAADGNLP